MLWLISVLAGVGYFLSIPWQPFPGSVVLKGLSVSMLALIAWRSSLDPSPKFALTAALALSSLGDVLLDIRPSFFVFGLGAFLLAHLLYVRLFLFIGPRKTDSSARIVGAKGGSPGRSFALSNRHRAEPLSGPRRALLAAVALFAIGFSAWLIPVLGAMTVPVVMYIGVLTAMVFSAIRWRTLRSDWVLYGAVLFLISDAVLGAAKFRGPVPLRGWLVWGTYYAAQLAITKGVLRELDRR